MESRKSGVNVKFFRHLTNTGKSDHTSDSNFFYEKNALEVKSYQNTEKFWIALVPDDHFF
jgi:hypothetical protein